VTAVPGTFPGRWPHLQFEGSAEAVAVCGAVAILTSQAVLPEEVCRAAYAADCI